MSIFQTYGVELTGLVACVPKDISKNSENKIFNNIEEVNKFIQNTGVKERRVVKNNTCTSDLTIAAAEKLLAQLKWEKHEVGLLICVTQTPDFHGPMNASIIQDRLGLSQDCLVFDIPIGCSGFIYGTSVVVSLMKTYSISKSILLVGDTLSKQASPKDRGTQPLFGDAGAAIAYNLTNNENDELVFDFGGDGSGYEALYVKHGGYRFPFNESSLKFTTTDDGIQRNGCHTIMNGTDVFSFGITTVPKSVNLVLSTIKQNVENINYFIFHQANLLMNEMIRKRIKAEIHQVPYCLAKYGNTSSATIPLTMASEIKSDLKTKDLNLLLCGFGIGLSWGTLYLRTSKIKCVELIEI
jgi:3-oxoacyl-[acyl-carrier-protein] synthase-3